MSEDVESVARVLKRAAGLSFGPGLSSTLSAAFHATSAHLGVDPATCLRRLNAGDQEAVTALIDRAVVSETYFFRQEEHFAALSSWIPAALTNPSPLRIWSAGCATGEEAYSAAIALLSAGRLGDRIVASDISRPALARAREGYYASWSFRRMDPAVRARFFAPEGGGWRLSAPVRHNVQFVQHNLVRDPPPGTDFHVVFCRNVLIYFEGEQLKSLLQSLVGALAPGGFLVVAVPEVPLVTGLPLERVERNGVVLFRKLDRLPAAGPARSVAPVQPRAQPPARATPPRPMPRPAPEPVSPTSWEQARAAARAGDLDRAEHLASQVAQSELLPEAFLLVAMAAEGRRDLSRAVEAVRRALYLDPGLAMGHAMLVALHTKLGATVEAERARKNALRLLEGVSDETLLRAVEPISAGNLRRALGEGTSR